MTTPTPGRRARLLIVLAAVVAVVAVVAALAWPRVSDLLERQAAVDTAVKQFEATSDKPLAGITYDLHGGFARAAGGYSAGEAQVFGEADSHDLELARDVLALGDPTQFDARLLFDRIRDRQPDCAERAVGSQLRVKRLDHTVTLTGCSSASGQATHLRVWLDDRELDTSFEHWITPEGLDFLRQFTEGAATDRMVDLDLSASRASVALVDEGRPDACRLIRWTWFRDADGVSLGGVTCEKLEGAPRDAHPAVGDWDPADTLGAMQSALADAKLPEGTVPDRARLSFATSDQSVPVLRLTAAGLDLASPLRSADAAAAEPADLPDLLDRDWPTQAGDWTVVEEPTIEDAVGRWPVDYRRGAVTIEAQAIRTKPGTTWYDDLVLGLGTVSVHDGAACGTLPTGFRLEGQASACAFPITGGALVVSTADDVEPAVLADFARHLTEEIA